MSNRIKKIKCDNYLTKYACWEVKKNKSEVYVIHRKQKFAILDDNS